MKKAGFLEWFIAGCFFGIVILIFIEGLKIMQHPEDVTPSHFILCPEMKSAVGVYGAVKAEGSYLRVDLTEDATSALLIGPECLIIPNVKEDK